MSDNKYREHIMKDSQWVRHFSRQGDIWTLRRGVGSESQWCVQSKNERDGYHWLPKSEYVLCEPPEVWVDVTGECEILAIGEIKHKGNHTMPRDGYRRRLVNVNFIGGGEPNGCRKGVAIIIERKQ